MFRRKRLRRKKIFDRICFSVSDQNYSFAHRNRVTRKLRNRLASMFHGTVKRKEGGKKGRKILGTTSTLVKRLWNRWTWSTFPSIAGRKLGRKLERPRSRESEVEKFHWMEGTFLSSIHEFETRHSKLISPSPADKIIRPIHAELRKIRVDFLNYIFRLLNSIPWWKCSVDRESVPFSTFTYFVVGNLIEQYRSLTRMQR